jgi:predicted RNA binding protein YcfA (HicA-like mRNA interferase family)
MSAPTLKLSEFRRILKSFGATEDKSAGKGSHTVFIKNVGAGTVTYPVPTTRNDVLPCYIKAVRKKFKLLPCDGISDDDFYGRK